MDQINDIIERVKDLKTTVMGILIMVGGALNDMGYSIEIDPQTMKVLLWVGVGVAFILTGSKKKEGTTDAN
jgi:predicted tellurium resistance membrane protein TerC